MSNATMTTKPESITRIEDALAAGPTEKVWRSYHDHGWLVVGTCDDIVVQVAKGLGKKSDMALANFIAACNPLAMREVLAHIEKQEAEIARLHQTLTSYADSQYCKALEMFGRPEYLGWEHKAATGKFTSVEYAAHKAANEAMGAHHGIYAALKLAALTMKGTV